MTQFTFASLSLFMILYTNHTVVLFEEFLHDGFNNSVSVKLFMHYFTLDSDGLKIALDNNRYQFKKYYLRRDTGGRYPAVFQTISRLIYDRHVDT